MTETPPAEDSFGRVSFIVPLNKPVKPETK